MKYLRQFPTSQEYDNFYWSDNYYEPLVGYVGQNNAGTSVFNKIEHILTFKSKNAFNIEISAVGTLNSIILTFQYSLNQGLSWTSQSLTAKDPSFTLALTGSPCTIQLRGNPFISTSNYYIHILFTPKSANPKPDDYIYSFGDVTSLLNNVGGNVSLSRKDYVFQNLFSDNPYLRTAPKLPSTTLSAYCYNSMFFRCSVLEKTPILPAETVVSNCYDSMFAGCDNLNEATLLCTSGNNPALSFRNWLTNVNTKGILHVPADIDANILQYIDIPKEWTIDRSGNVGRLIK